MTALGKLSEAGQADLVRLATTDHTPCPICLTHNGMVIAARHNGLCLMHHMATRHHHRTTITQQATHHIDH